MTVTPGGIAINVDALARREDIAERIDLTRHAAQSSAWQIGYADGVTGQRQSSQDPHYLQGWVEGRLST